MAKSKPPSQSQGQSAADVARIIAANMRENQNDADFLIEEARRRQAAAEKVMADEVGPPDEYVPPAAKPGGAGEPRGPRNGPAKK